LQIVEIILLKLEIEPSFHRRVDFWFLLDSVTQVAHTQKGGFLVSDFLPFLERDLVVRLSWYVSAGDEGVLSCRGLFSLRFCLLSGGPFRQCCIRYCPDGE
jgi:hypothetical protein